MRKIIYLNTTKLFQNKLTAPLIIAALFTFIYSYHSLVRHLTFNSHAFDLGIYSQITYIYSTGIFPAYSTLKHMTLLADHFGLILFIFSPIYKLFPSPNSLLIFQALSVSISSIFIYLIVLDKLKGRLLSGIITLCYLTSVGIISAVDFDFHLSTASVLPLSLIIYSWYFKKWRLYWFSLFLSILYKEDVPLFLLGLGMFQLFSKQYKLGLATATFSLISGYLIKFIIMKNLWPGGGESYISTMVIPFDSPYDLLGLIILRPRILLDQMINAPDKIQTFDLLFKQFAYFPIISGVSWLIVIPALFFRFNSTYIQSWSTNFHHNANIEPFLALAAIFAISKAKISPVYISLLLGFFLLTSGLQPGSIVWEPLQNTISNIKHYTYINNNLDVIPNYAKVSAQSPIVPHLVNREKIYLYPDIFDAEYIVLDPSLSTYPMNPADLQNNINKLKQSSLWKIELEIDNLFVFKKN